MISAFPVINSKPTCAVRVPIPVVILLVLLVLGGVWWSNTRHMDFSTPPSEARLQEIRIHVESSLPRADQVGDAITPPTVVKAPEPPPLPVEEPKPIIDLGDLTAALTLQGYGERSQEGAAYMVELATTLEDHAEPRRALLAWERVLDLTQPDDSQAATAISAIKRLRPTLPEWNTDTKEAKTITLHAGTGKKLAKAISPVLKEVAGVLELASSGIIKVKTDVTVGKANNTNNEPSPVALWISGTDRKSTSTEVMSITVDSPDTLRQQVMKTVYQLMGDHLGSNTAYTKPSKLTHDEDLQAALNFHITRLCWSEFAAAMNTPAKKVEKTEKTD